jgi:transposase-like protein
LAGFRKKTTEGAGSGLKPFPGHDRPRDEELICLRKENKALRNANEILKKAYVPQAHVIFAQGNPPFAPVFTPVDKRFE